MKRYIFEVVMEEANDEWWEELVGSGCNELEVELQECIGNHPYISSIVLKSFTDA